MKASSAVRESILRRGKIRETNLLREGKREPPRVPPINAMFHENVERERVPGAEDNSFTTGKGSCHRGEFIVTVGGTRAGVVTGSLNFDPLGRQSKIRP